MVWQIQDEHGIEDQLKSMGESVWTNWSELVRPHLIEDPTHTNSNLEWDGTFDDQIGIPDTDVWVTFEADNAYVYLTGVVDISYDPN